MTREIPQNRRQREQQNAPFAAEQPSTWVEGHPLVTCQCPRCERPLVRLRPGLGVKLTIPDPEWKLGRQCEARGPRDPYGEDLLLSLHSSPPDCLPIRKRPEEQFALGHPLAACLITACLKFDFAHQFDSQALQHPNNPNTLRRSRTSKRQLTLSVSPSMAIFTKTLLSRWTS